MSPHSMSQIGQIYLRITSMKMIWEWTLKVESDEFEAFK